jgi:hypothetical protein
VRWAVRRAIGAEDGGCRVRFGQPLSLGGVLLSSRLIELFRWVPDIAVWLCTATCMAEGDTIYLTFPTNDELDYQQARL